MNFEGSAKDAERFLTLLEALPYASSIEMFSYSVQGRGDGLSTVAGSVSLLVSVQTYE